MVTRAVDEGAVPYIHCDMETMRACVRACIHARVHKCLYVLVHVFVCLHACVCSCEYTYTQTNNHTAGFPHKYQHTYISMHPCVYNCRQACTRRMIRICNAYMCIEPLQKHFFFIHACVLCQHICSMACWGDRRKRPVNKYCQRCSSAKHVVCDELGRPR